MVKSTPNMTPYELRFKVLEMARDLVVNEYDLRNAVLWNLVDEFKKMIDSFGEYATTTGRVEWLDETKELWRQMEDCLPHSPEPHEINEKAKELYEFVSTK